MVLESNDKIISPKQPFFVMGTLHYYKAVIMNYGISHFYCFQKDASLENCGIAVPDGCIDILFCCDDEKPYANICGTVLHPYEAFTEKNKYYFGVRFLPGSSPKFKNATLSDFVEHEIPFLDVIDDKELFEQITNSRNFSYQIQVFMDKYLNLYQNAPIKALKQFLVDRIKESCGQIKVNELSYETGYSVRYINKLFTKEFGLAPKVFCKLMRFQYLLSNLNEFENETFEANLAELATEIGYYDQSHMIKDFYEYTNITPVKYIHSLQETEYKKRLVII